MKEIKLTQGYVALVDDEDFEELNKYSWRLTQGRNGANAYAIREDCSRGIRSTIRMHRQIMGILFGDKIDVDHKDGNGLNNQKANLRKATHQQNCYNSKKRENTSSVYKGVTHTNSSKNNPWMVRGQLDGTSIYLGIYSTQEEAALVYNNFARKSYGEFAKLNDI